MIVFELTMPHRGSWNGRWSGENSSHIIVKRNKKELNHLIDRSFRFRWDDGWEAEITVSKMNADSKEFKDLVRRNTGFRGYDWMVDSIIKNGEIVKAS